MYLELSTGGFLYIVTSRLPLRQTRHFSFRHSLAIALQYFILSTKTFAEGSFSMSCAVETSPVFSKSSFSHDLSCFFVSLSTRETLVSITADSLKYCLRKSWSFGKSFKRFLAVSNCLTSSVGPKICSSARPCFVRQTISCANLLVGPTHDFGCISVNKKPDYKLDIT